MLEGYGLWGTAEAIMMISPVIFTIIELFIIGAFVGFIVGLFKKEMNAVIAKADTEEKEKK